MGSGGVWTTSSSVGNAAACAWSQEALINESGTGSFKPVSKWRILRRVFNCTRIWRYVGRQAHDLKVRYTVDLQFRAVGVNQELAVPSKPSCNANPTVLPLSMSSESLADAKQLYLSAMTARRGCKSTSCKVQDLVFSGQGFVPFMVVAFATVALTLECDQHPTDHVDWGGLGISNYLQFGTVLVQSKNSCVSIVKLFQAASILLFQAAYFWLKFREASSAGCKRKPESDLQGEGAPQPAGKGVYLRVFKDRDGNVVRRKYEPRFKPPREKTAQGNVLSFARLSLGSYNDRREAEIVRHIAAFYYDKADKDLVSLGDGLSFRIPAVKALRGLSGAAKAKWVSKNAKKVFQLYRNRTVAPELQRPQSGTTQSNFSSLHTPSGHITSSQSTDAADSVTMSPDPVANQAWLQDPTTASETRTISVAPSATISHSEDHGAQNLAWPLLDKGSNLSCTSPNISAGLVITEQTGFSTEIDTIMDVDKDSGDSAPGVGLQPTSRRASLNCYQPLQDNGEFSLRDLDDHRVELDYQSEGMVDSMAYCQLQPFPGFIQAPTPSDTINTHISQFDLAPGQYGIQFQSSEGGTCKWGMDAAVHNSHCGDGSYMVSSQQAMAQALAQVAPSLCSASFCFESELMGVISCQRKQIEDLERENARLKGTLGVKHCSVCGVSQLFY